MIEGNDGGDLDGPVGGAAATRSRTDLARRLAALFLAGAGEPAQPNGAKRRVTLFVRIVAAGMVLALAHSFVMTHFLQRGYPYNTFLVGVRNQFMDFFNVNYNSYDLNPYPRLTPYPPFAMLLARGFACGFDYAAGPLAARDSPAGRLSYGILAGGFCVFLFALVWRGVRTGNRSLDVKLLAALFVSYPILFVLDRGNYVMAAFVCLFGFIHFYDKRRFLCVVCLALAISIKLYPAVFLLLLAADRRWRDAAWVVGLTLVINVASFPFFRGGLIPNAEQFLRNVFLFAPAKTVFSPMWDACWSLSFCNLFRVPYVVFLHRAPDGLPYYYPAIELAAIGALILALRRERTFWKRVLAATIAMICVPSFSQDYNLVYLIIPVLLYFRQSAEFRWQDYFYLASLGLLFTPKAYYVFEVVDLNALTPQAFLNPLLLLGLFLALTAPRIFKSSVGARLGG
ncbi:MAG TPA: glycosyltransferase family 87 protein [Gemmataceae bacterium]|nr:glycosyltransferase family 87 protein [Gemmataceae bacterium]